MKLPFGCLSCVLAALSMIAGAVNVASAVITAPRAERFDATRVTLTWTSPNAMDLYWTTQPDANLSQAHLLAKNNHDGRYLATILSDKRPYFLLRDTRDGEEARVSERLLPLERASNFRDIGGYTAANGKHVRWGMIYRSAATPLLSDQDIKYVGALGLNTMIDLRSTEERQLAPSRLIGSGIRYGAIDYSFKDLPRNYPGMLTALAPQYREVFRQLLTNAAPISYNCTAGQDRTGITTALILSALGVPRDTIVEDYHLSTVDRRPEYETPPIDPSRYPDNPAAALLAQVRLSKPPALYTTDGRSMLSDMFDNVDKRWGSIDRYLQEELNLGPAEIAKLRATYLQ